MEFNVFTIVWLSLFAPILNVLAQEVKIFFERLLYKSISLKPSDNGYNAILHYVKLHSFYIDSLQTSINDNGMNDLDTPYKSYEREYIVSPGRYYLKYGKNFYTVILRMLDSEFSDEIEISCFLSKSFDTLFEFKYAAETEYRILNKDRKDIYCFNENRYKWMFKKETKLPCMSHVVLRNDVRIKILELLDTYKMNQSKYEELMIPYKFGCILEGPHGTGKTSFAKALCSEFNFQRIYILDPTKKNIWESISDIKKNSLILVEDIDRYFDANKNQIVQSNIKDQDGNFFDLSQFLNFLDGVNSPQGCIICLTTNNIGVIPDVLLRPGRIQMHIRFSQASFQEIYDYTQMFYRDNFDEVIAHTIAKHLDNKITISELQKCYLSYINDLKNACIHILDTYQ